MSGRFDYLITKIREAAFSDVPFRHVMIENFFSPEDFQALTNAREIKLPPSRDDADLFENLFKHHYKIINFPGCIIDKDTYLAWHRKRGAIGANNNSACEGFGMTLRLVGPEDEFLREMIAFMDSAAFNQALADKMGIDRSKTHADSGIQKYLDGYEISPHPDIRKKALTYMVNINPTAEAEKQEHHTHYLKFKDSHRYVQEFWRGNPRIDRCWVPWDWCESVKEQRANNSFVLFAPGDDTMHGVKANYNHLIYQRTQLYGNLWYNNPEIDGTINWEELRLDASKFTKPVKPPTRLADFIPSSIKTAIKSALGRGESGYHNRPNKLPNQR